MHTSRDLRRIRKAGGARYCHMSGTIRTVVARWLFRSTFCPQATPMPPTASTFALTPPLPQGIPTLTPVRVYGAFWQHLKMIGRTKVELRRLVGNTRRETTASWTHIHTRRRRPHRHKDRDTGATPTGNPVPIVGCVFSSSCARHSS